MHTFLAILGWVLLALLAVFVLLLVVPVRMTVELKYDKLTVAVKVLFFSFRLYPLKEKKKQPQEDAAETPREPAETSPPEQPPAEQQAEKPRKGKRITLSDIVELVRTAGWLMKIVFKVIRFTGIKLLLPVHREDAAETAIAYGQTQAYLGTALGALQNFLNLKFSKLEILPDFTGSSKYLRYFYCKIVATPFIMVAAALYAFTHLKVERIL